MVALVGSLFVNPYAYAATVSCTIDAPKEVRYGDTGSCVQLLQTRLGGLARDGQFGSLTQFAVVQFQRAYRLQADGIAGPKTWAAIKNYLSGSKLGTVLYAGTGAHVGISVYACRDQYYPTLVKFATYNDSTKFVYGVFGYYGSGTQTTSVF